MARQPAQFRESSAGLSIHIVGSDLLPQNIEAADRGVYPQSALDGLPPATIRNYFSKISSPVGVAEWREANETKPRATAKPKPKRNKGWRCRIAECFRQRGPSAGEAAPS